MVRVGIGRAETQRLRDISVIGAPPSDQDYGVRDYAFRDPAGNLIRVTSAPA